MNDSSGKTSQIIKAIDEIAFQTNILALHAAVEAKTAANPEEIVSKSEGMSAQAETMRGIAQRLRRMVGEGVDERKSVPSVQHPPTPGKPDLSRDLAALYAAVSTSGEALAGVQSELDCAAPPLKEQLKEF